MGEIKRVPRPGYKPTDDNVIRQRTLNSRISCSGIALHSGARVTMTLNPAEPNTGIVFVRTDIEGGGARIPARWDHVVCTRLCTTVGDRNGVQVATIEHLMAALAGCGIDNAVIEVNGPEVPVMDGSAAPFVFLVECAGTVEQAAPRRGLRIRKPVSVRDEKGGTASLLPADSFSIDIRIKFDSRVVSRQNLSLDLVNGAFKKELSRARTFGFLHEVEELRAAGLARGGSLDNAVVVSGDTVLNEGGLRYEDEFVRHKALDAVGDLYTAGGPIIGAFHGTCSGHRANNLLLRALFAERDAWSFDVLRSGQPDAVVGLGGSWQASRAAAAAPL